MSVNHIKKISTKIMRPASQANNVDRNDLPGELVKQLSRGKRLSPLNDEILEWAESHGETFVLDDVLIAFYQMKSEIYKKGPMAARLHKLATIGNLKKVGPGVFKFACK